MTTWPNRTWRDWSCSVRVTVQSTDDADLAVAVEVTEQLMAQVGSSIDRFRPDSELSRVNAAAGRLVPVGPLTSTLVRAACDAARRTDGACDPTVGSAVIASGYDADISVLADAPRATTDTAPAPGWQRIRFDDTLHRIGVPRGTVLDLGATAKAWTADEAAARAARRTGRPVLVALGGDLAVAGGASWTVDVAEREGGCEQRVALSRGGVATSSTLVRRWETTDGPRHHLVDPATGRPADGPWRTCSVWADSACEANAASTAALVLGEDAEHWLRHHDHAARLVDHRGQVVVLGDWPVPEERAA